jgi:hypothetical protein
LVELGRAILNSPNSTKTDDLDGGEHENTKCADPKIHGVERD